MNRIIGNRDAIRDVARGCRGIDGRGSVQSLLGRRSSGREGQVALPLLWHGVWCR